MQRSIFLWRSRLLERAKQRIHTEDGSSADERYTPMEIAERVEELLRKLEALSTYDLQF